MIEKHLGLAYRARQVTIGTEMTIERLRSKDVSLIILAKDASIPTKKKIYDKAKTYETDVIEILDAKDMSNAIGKKDIKVIGITDKGFSRLMMNEQRK
jgi:ribosomal protein L7Ae-like RNA K-turn-binding protein